MKKVLLFWLLTMGTATVSPAAPISEGEAREMARTFFVEHQMGADVAGPALQKKCRAVSSSGRQADYYVFNAASGDGFVVIGGDDRCEPVLGYGTGGFDVDALPSNVAWWFDRYASQLAAAEGNAPVVRTARAAVTPFVTSKWNQVAPYNSALPLVSSQRPVTGCVAIALAQVLYYYKSPVSSTAISNGSLPARTFNYSIMKDSYGTGETGTGVDEMAQLVLYCARAVNTKFGVNLSTATSTAKPLVDYFGFSKSAAVLNHDYFTAREWEEIIYEEVASRRPVMISARDHEAGHTVLCDGYDGNGYFHINWGWGGKYNGFFRIDVLNPYAKNLVLPGDDEETTMYTDPGFSLDQFIMIGLKPAEDGEGTFVDSHLAISKKMTCVSTPYTRSATGDNFTNVTVGFTAANTLYAGGTVNYGIALCQGEEIKQILVDDDATVRAGNMLSSYHKVDFGAGLPDGEYRLCVVMRATSSDAWQPCYGTMRNALKAVIAGNKLTTTAPDAFTHHLVINSLTPKGPLVVGKPVAIEANITNAGTANYSDIYLYSSGKRISAYGVSLEAGETGTVDLCFTPTSAGTMALEVWDNDEENLLASTSITITANDRVANLGMTLRALNARSDRTIVGDSIVAEVVITNKYDLEYNDEITIIAHPGDNRQVKVLKWLVLAGSESKTLTVTINGLEYGVSYYLKGRYLSEGQLVTGGNSVSYVMVEPDDNPIAGDVNGDGIVSGSDVTALYNVLLNDSTAAGNADVNGDGVVSGADVTALYTILLSQ